MATLPTPGPGDVWGTQLNDWLRVAHNADGTAVSGGGGTTDPEVVRDTIAAALVAGTGVTITPDDAANNITISASGGGGGTGDAVVTVAASNTPTAQKTNADYTCDGTNDNVEIQAAIDTVAQNASGGGKVTLLAGTYNLGATVSVGHPSDGTNTYRIHLDGEKGSKITWTGVTGTVPLIKVESSDCVVSNLWVQGSGAKGNGIGICFGGDTTNYAGRYTKTVYRCSAQDCYITNCRNGITFAVDKLGTSSSGDNAVYGGFITNCVDGINSAGFVNRVFGTTIAVCDNCIHGTPDRNSQRIDCFGVTLNSWAVRAIWLEKDHGSLFSGCWAEHTAVQSAVPTEAILLGGTTNSTYKAQNTRFVGTFFLTLFDETYGVKIVNGQNVRFDNLCMSTDGNMPVTAVIREESTNTGLVTVDRLTWGTGTVPATWTYSKILSTAATTPQVVVKAIPGVAGAASNTTFGDTTPTPVDATYHIDKAGAANSATYWAKDRRGHIAAFSADTGTTSGLKSVLASLTASDVHFRFGPGRYHFLNALVGNEAWAGVEDHAVFGTTTPPVKGLTFSGAGMYSTIISNRSNFAGGTDTEPLSFTNCQYVTMRDFTVESCGTYKSTTDALDFDQGAHIRIERVRITHSRARGIIIDGGDLGKWAGHNVIRDCLVQGRPDKPGLGLVSGGTLTASTAYRYVVSWTDADLAGAQTAGETKPSDENVITTDATNKSVRVDLAIGPYTVTERKVYRAQVGSSTWVRVATISDNTTTTYTDTGGAGTGVTMPVSHRSTIYDSAIELLGCNYSDIENNTVDGAGDFTSGLNAHGINISRKSTVPTVASYNKVLGNTVRQCAGNGIRMLGAADTMCKDNDVSNSGTVATRAACIRVEGATGISTLRNEIKDNRCFDDQDANSWSAGQTVNNQIIISATGTPTDTLITGNVLTAGASGASATILDQGTNSIIWDNYGWNAEFSLFESGAEETGNFTITQLMSSQTKKVNSGSTVTVTVPVLKQGTTLKLIRWGAGAVSLAASGTTLRLPSGNSAAPRLQYSAIQLDWISTTDVLITGDMG